MLKRVILIGALLISPAIYAMTLWYSSGSAGISATQTNTTVTFTFNTSGGTSAAFAARHVYIRSRSTSASSCYYDMADGTATTADHRLDPGERLVENWDPNPSTDRGSADGWSNMGVICDTGGTATIDISASR
jgi:hypothetical protein